ncbi:MAG TPA: iron ABC transporter permease [Nitrospira sp.]|nr:iron ABC transporter permease [Nitrospira sp.]
MQRAILTPSRWLRVISILLVASIIVVVLCLQVGARHITVGEIVKSLARALGVLEPAGEASATTDAIILHLRMPRMFLGFLVGCSLASVGVILQALLRNPLADPYVLGVSSGAALGVSLGVLFGLGAMAWAIPVLPICGFFGGLVALAVLYRISSTTERLPVHSVLLAGVILNAIFSALIMFITSIMEPNRSFSMMSWLMGTLTAPIDKTLLAFTIYIAIGVGLLFTQVGVLNVMTLGEEPARSLGVDTERAKRNMLMMAALVTGGVVSLSGMIGFIGMVVPHAMRLLIGADHRLLLPASGLAGGMFLVTADTFARSFFLPSEIPVGIMTALAGGPFFIYLLMWRKDRLS